MFLLTNKRCKYLYSLMLLVCFYVLKRFEGCILVRLIQPRLKWCIYNKKRGTWNFNVTTYTM